MGLKDVGGLRGSKTQGSVENEENDTPESLAHIEDINTDGMSKEKERGFFLGLVSGEASFSVRISSNNSGVYTNCVFALQMHECDAAIIKHFYESMKMGNIRHRKDKRGNRGNHVNWKVSNTEQCRVIADWVEKHSENSFFRHTDKYRAFCKWEKCLTLIEEGEHLTDEGVAKIAGLRDQMNHDSRGRTKEEVVEEFNLEV